MNEVSGRLGFVISFLESLQQEGLRPILLRGDRELQEGREKDVDILCEARYFLRAISLMQEHCRQRNWLLVRSVVSSSSLYLTCVEPDQIGSTRSVRLQLQSYVSLAVSAAQIRIKGYSTRVRPQSVECRAVVLGAAAVDMPTDQWALLMLLGRIYRSSKQAHWSAALELAEAGVPESMGLSKEPFVRAIEQQDVRRAVELARQMWQRLRPRWSIWDVARDWAELLLANLATLGNGRGLILIFSGPDGAGKSTTMASLQTFLVDELGVGSRTVRGLSPMNNSFGPTMTRAQERLRGVPVAASADVKQQSFRDRPPQEGGGMWKARRLLGLLFLLTQYYFGYAAARIQNLTGTTIIVDTSVHDRFVKAHRPRFRWLERLTLPWIPGGDILFRLIADPVAIHSRKPELTVEEITKYYAAMAQILADVRVCEKVQTDAGLAKASAHVNRAVASSFARKSIR